MYKQALLFFGIVSFLCGGQNCKAGTVDINISALAGFTQNGVTEIFGNGIVFLSPVYIVGYGATVDFGLAELAPNTIDGRGGCFLNNSCEANYGFQTGFYQNGLDAPTFAPFDLSEIGGSADLQVGCPNSVCPTVEIPLLFTLPIAANSIQFAFQGSAISIEAPVPEPSTWVMLLLGFCGLGFMAYRKNAAVSFARSPASSDDTKTVVSAWGGSGSEYAAA